MTQFATKLQPGGLAPTEILSATLQNGGGTFGAGGYPIHSGGYVVGGVAPGRVLQVPVARVTSPTFAEQRQLLRHVAGLIRDGVEFGTWIDSDAGILWVEPIEFVTDRDAAIQLARERGELAIFHLDSEEEIRVA